MLAGDNTKHLKVSKIVSEYDQEIPQLQTADNLMAPRGRARCKVLMRGICYFGLVVRKPVFGGFRTTQAQTSLRIRAD